MQHKVVCSLNHAFSTTASLARPYAAARLPRRCVSSGIQQRAPVQHALTRSSPPCSRPHHTTSSPSRIRQTVCRAAARENTVTVVEYLLLLKAKPDADPAQLLAMLDELWSLQYVVPSILCASVGQVLTSTGAPPCTPAAQAPSASSPTPDTHIIHYRLNNRPALDQFLVHPLYQKMRSHDVAKHTSAAAEVVYEGTTDNDLMSIFRKGDGFETGLDYYLFMQPGPSMDLQGSQQFLRKLAELSQSSAAGGVQCSYGTTLSSVHCPCSHVMAVRFQTEEHASMFAATPAVAALLAQDARLPLLCTTSITALVEPAQASSSEPGQ